MSTQVVTADELKDMLKPSKGRIRNIAPKAERTYAGRVYDSKAEANYAFGLDKLKSAGKIRDWEPQFPLSIVVYNVTICKVWIDFRVMLMTGRDWYIEIKGMETEVYKLKSKLLKACYPSLDYRVVKA